MSCWPPPALDDLDPVAVGIADEAQPAAPIRDRVRGTFRFDALILELGEGIIELGRRDRDVSIAAPDVVRLGAADVVGQLEARLGPVVRETHEHVDRLVPDWQPPDLVEAERLVEGDRAVDVEDPVAGVDQAHADPGYRPRRGG
jgi:hypothetical protein